jgi:small subunit ribosomal protein S17
MAEENDNVEEAQDEGSTADAPEAAEPADAPEPVDAGDEPATAAGAAEPAEAAQQLSPKERRRQARSRHGGDVRPSRTAEERQAERDAERRRKAEARRRYRAKLRTRAAERRSGESPPEPTPPAEHGSGRQKVRQGVVVSDKADKTITVRVDMARRHRRYQKIVRSSSTLHAHDERNDAHAGDKVRVVESRPLSRTKRWRLLEVLERAR